MLHDFYGNPIPARSGRITIPLHQLGYFLRTDRRPGAFAKLLAAVAQAQLFGIEPVEIVAHDFLAPITQKPTVKLKVTNVLNRRVAGRLRVEVDGLEMLPAEETISLEAHESRVVYVAVADGQPRADNSYRLLATFDAGQTVKFSFRVNNGGDAFELAAGRSVSKDNPLAFHNDWSTHWANELEFLWER